jgi:hypothetical protein
MSARLWTTSTCALPTAKRTSSCWRAAKTSRPSRWRTALIRNPYIEQAVIYGDKKKFVAALIVPDFVQLEEWAQQQGIRV